MITNIDLHTTQLNKIASVTQPSLVNSVATTATQGDQVSISDSAKIVMQSINDTGSPVDLDRVMQLQMQIQEGNYAIDGNKIANNLIHDAQEL